MNTILDEIEEAKGTKMYDYHDPNGYKIRCGLWYPVYRQEYGGRIFYKMPVSKKLPDGNTIQAYKSVSFRNKERDCNVKDGALIKPLKLWEDFYFKKDDKYNPIFTIAICDWEERLPENIDKMDAIQEYKQTTYMDDINVTDDLPF